MKEILGLSWRPLAMLLVLVVCFSVVNTPATIQAQDAPVVEDATPAVDADAPTTDATEDEATEGEAAASGTGRRSSSDHAEFMISNLWIMLAGMLVFIMHLGFATLESGLTRSKNTVNILFKNTMIVCIGIITYGICGFNLMYPGYDGGTKGADGVKTYEDGGYFKFGDEGFGFLLNGPAAAAAPSDDDKGKPGYNENMTVYNDSSTPKYGDDASTPKIDGVAYTKFAPTSFSKRCLQPLAARLSQVQLLVE